MRHRFFLDIAHLGFIFPIIHEVSAISSGKTIMKTTNPDMYRSASTNPNKTNPILNHNLLTCHIYL